MFRVWFYIDSITFFSYPDLYAQFIASSDIFRNSKGKSVSWTWTYRFLQRHPEFKLETATVSDLQRNLASCVNNLHPFFILYTKLLLNPHYHDTLIYNLDETPLCIHQSPKRTVITLPNNRLPRLALPPEWQTQPFPYVSVLMVPTYLPTYSGLLRNYLKNYLS